MTKTFPLETKSLPCKDQTDTKIGHSKTKIGFYSVWYTTCCDMSRYMTCCKIADEAYCDVRDVSGRKKRLNRDVCDVLRLTRRVVRLVTHAT